MPQPDRVIDSPVACSRRQVLSMSGVACGLGLHQSASCRNVAASDSRSGALGKAKSCILVYLWGGLSHLESFDLKPHAPQSIRGEFQPIATNVPGIEICEHLPLLSQQADKLAIIRSVNHDDPAHGRGMYWNLTGHRPPRVGNIPPERDDWPSLPAMVSKFRSAPRGVPNAVRLPYPMVDNGTLQAGEYGGWLGIQCDPILMRPSAGDPYEGKTRTLGSEVLNLSDVDVRRLAHRRQLMETLESASRRVREHASFQHFHDLAEEMLSGSAIKHAYNLEAEDIKTRDLYGKHLGGNSLLLARRLTEVGVPIVQVCLAAGELDASSGDMWDTHVDHFNRLKKRLLPIFDRATSALLQDLSDRGTLNETLVVVMTDFGRTPSINGNAGRDHYPYVYSMAMAGGGIVGGQVYGSSDSKGAFPKSQACSPADVHATIFHAMGISPRSELRDILNRPHFINEGEVLALG